MREHRDREEGGRQEGGRGGLGPWYLRRGALYVSTHYGAPWYQRGRLYNESYTAVYNVGDLTDVYISIPRFSLSLSLMALRRHECRRDVPLFSSSAFRLALLVRKREIDETTVFGNGLVLSLGENLADISLADAGLARTRRAEKQDFRAGI